MNQTETAAISYSKSTEVVSTINDVVLNHIRHYGKSSRNGIQLDLRLTARQVSCACWHLLKQGKIRQCGTAYNFETKRDVELLEINDTPELNFAKLSNGQKLEMIKQTCDDWFLDFNAVQLKENILSIINS